MIELDRLDDLLATPDSIPRESGNQIDKKQNRLRCLSYLHHPSALALSRDRVPTLACRYELGRRRFSRLRRGPRNGWTNSASRFCQSATAFVFLHRGDRLQAFRNIALLAPGLRVVALFCNPPADLRNWTEHSQTLAFVRGRVASLRLGSSQFSFRAVRSLAGNHRDSDCGIFLPTSDFAQSAFLHLLSRRFHRGLAHIETRPGFVLHHLGLCADVCAESCPRPSDFVAKSKTRIRFVVER